LAHAVVKAEANARPRAITLGISAGLFAHLVHGMVDPGFVVNLTISQLIAAQIGVVGWFCLAAKRHRGAVPTHRVKGVAE
jgi:hypothetical protein